MLQDRKGRMRVFGVFSRFAIAACLLHNPAPAHAQQWVRVEGTELYFDSKSIDRKGEIASIRVSLRGSEGNSGTLEFDCKRRLMLLPDREYVVSSGDSYEPVLIHACRPWWRFWGKK